MAGQYFDIKKPSPRPIPPAAMVKRKILPRRYLIVIGTSVAVVVVAFVTFGLLNDLFPGKASESHYRVQENGAVLGEQSYLKTAEERDSKRSSDLREIKFSLEQYKLFKNKYPQTDGLQKVNQPEGILSKTILGEKYLLSLPRDPLFPDQDYWYESDGETFQLVAYLEMNKPGTEGLHGQPVVILKND